ncbi:MAG: hypothetical protein FE78DRAFT_85018 [Acidomyces sp. 'richmondensis']|nr:MAG: hypothetical protein FE78DRAFT_85018 [Acidomyces sp. 'richmondensis']
MDGYSSHITADFIAFCIDNAIDILILPPHFSHALQPLNVSVFLPLKKALTAETDKLTRLDPGRTLRVSYPLDLSLLASSLLDSTELRKANALLHSKLDKEQPLLLPTKRYTKRITCTLKIAQSEVALLRKWLTDTESLPQARKQRKKGKRIALKGKFVFSTQEKKPKKKVKEGAKATIIDNNKEEDIEIVFSDSDSDCIVVAATRSS